MKDILDTSITESNRPAPTFSKLAFMVAVLNIGLIGYIIWSMPTTIKASEGVPVPNEFLIIGSRITIILGFLFSVISLVRKEDAVYFKWIAVWINFLLMIFFVYAVVNSLVNG